MDDSDGLCRVCEAVPAQEGDDVCRHCEIRSRAGGPCLVPNCTRQHTVNGVCGYCHARGLTVPRTYEATLCGAKQAPDRQVLPEDPERQARIAGHMRRVAAELKRRAAS